MSTYIQSDTLLWFDNNSNRKFSDRLRDGVNYYLKKHGRRPTRCDIKQLTFEALKAEGYEVSTTDEGVEYIEFDGVRVFGHPNIRAGDFHIGKPDELL